MTGQFANRCADEIMTIGAAPSGLKYAGHKWVWGPPLFASPSGAALPIIILTDSEAMDAQQRTFSLRATEYLLKPFTYSKLKAMLQRLMIRWSPASEPVGAQGVPIEPSLKG